MKRTGDFDFICIDFIKMLNNLDISTIQTLDFVLWENCSFVKSNFCTQAPPPHLGLPFPVGWQAEMSKDHPILLFPLSPSPLSTFPKACRPENPPPLLKIPFYLMFPTTLQPKHLANLTDSPPFMPRRKN